ncbi:MFS transporter [Sphingomonas sp. 28-63-12]|uniref:MFS transporter n=1 Tax=Sphingomonas sp. 28-63-12 TaxID=1970434 RepID=UPI000BD2419F|nr:MAG: sodium:melibiose symporter [Sphingomonas sp. 28-63-12]
MSVAVAVPPARVLPMRSRLAFGLGSIAYGVKDNGFATFLLLFYNQVVGLSAASVGIAIMMAMMVEAFVDPAVGFLSDHTRSKWGRRHPWMYGSAIPVAIGWLLLWNPPLGWSQTGLLFYLFGSALLVRIALSAFEIPASALGPELSSDYDERTKLFSYRYLFGWVGGLGMLSLAYGVFLVPDAGHAIGLQNGPGYSSMASLAAIVMVLAIVLSSWGLHGEIKYLPKLAESTETLGDHFRAFRQTISNRAFVILMIAGVCAYTAQGISFALSNYMYQYVWEFSGGDYQWLSLALLCGAIMAFVMAPRLTKGGDKARVGAILSVVNVLLVVAPYILRLMGLFPVPQSPVALPLLLTIFAANTACGVSAFIIGASMLSDVVEESELRTGRRSEGVFFSGSFFVQKMVGGLGIFMAGTILSIAQFPASAKPGQVPLATVDRLTLIFIILLLLFYGLAAFTYSRFPFGRAEHQARLARMGAGGE